jgi:hypothetical protein
MASHIKPWCKCSNEEKLDGNNGFLLAPHVDKLFDGGWITFSLDGSIRAAGSDVTDLLISWGIDLYLNIGSFNAEQKKYLKYHNHKVFIKISLDQIAAYEASV